MFPTKVDKSQLGELVNQDQLRDVLLDDALAQYEVKERLLGADTMREIERRVMLSVIDQHWREHLYEMDYLREGINLRAMGQRDPLAEWQREGFDMFEAMMGATDDDFVAYVSHVEVVADEQPRSQVRNVRYTAAEDPVEGSGAMRAAATAAPLEEPGDTGPLTTGDEAVNAPVRVDKTPGRNEPCYCGSGKKYKLCHGR